MSFSKAIVDSVKTNTFLRVQDARAKKIILESRDRKFERIVRS